MSWSQPVYEAVARLVASRTGLAFPPHRCASAEPGIRRAMDRSGVTEPDRYLQRLAADDNLLDDLIGELTIGETYFFREPGQFEFIRRRILPEILRCQGGQHPIRVWSAGCATGEEAYSLAILFEQEGVAERTQILATDLSRVALERARQGLYSAWSLRAENAAPVHPYLTPEGKFYRLQERIRRRVAFGYLNLALDVYPSFANATWGVDLILCRNVLIYLDAETVQGVVRRLFRALAEGGWLLTASSDPPLPEGLFQPVVTEEGVFYRRQPAVQMITPDLSFRAESERETINRPAPVEKPPTRAPLDEAREAFSLGDYPRVVERTRDLTEDAAATELHVRALANLDPAAAERACATALQRHPLAAELVYLHAVLLMGLRRDEEAIRAVRRVLYLDRSLAVAHLTLGTLLGRRDDATGARRAFRNAHALCAARPAEQVVPLADGACAGRLAEAAALQLSLLDTPTR
jgi:chemotaxis protein methyltransferase CheR